MRVVRIGGQDVGNGQRTLFIAEAGVNHNGDVQTAQRLVDVAAEAGADAVKFQTFRADRVASVAARKADYQRVVTDPDESQVEMLRRLELPPAAHEMLRDHCRRRGVLFLSTPFDHESVDLLDALDVPAFKIGSGELTNLPFLAYIAGKERPVILSTGMADLSEVNAAVGAIRSTGNDQVVLLHCVSSYPADPAEANLRAMRTMADAFGAPVGYSDHTPGLEVALAAVALGAAVLEKHFTLDRNQPGPDHRASLEPVGLAALVRGIRMVEAALGHGEKCPMPSEMANRTVVRRSLVAVQDVPAGAVLRLEMLSALRPGSGISPSQLDAVVGRRVRRALQAGQLLAWDDLE